MNYRHAFHAGNHADVLKHVVLVRVIEHMKKKDKGFALIDAFAGPGLYALDSMEALKTGEWQGGIGKLAAPFAAGIEALLAPYRAVVAALNPEGPLGRYPGSPELARRLLRPQDRMIFNELHPDDHRALAALYAGDGRISVSCADAGTILRSRLPPPERRGLVLIDPPYEQPDEATRAVAMLGQGLKRFATGVFVLWYPLKADATAAEITRAAAALGRPATLQVELRVREPFAAGGLAGSGLIIVNTPWQLDAEIGALAPALAGRLGLGQWGRATVAWRVPPA